MDMLDVLRQRRSYYSLTPALPVSEQAVEERVRTLTELVPDAFNMKSSRVVLAFGEASRRLWDAVYDSFGGKVPRAKIDSFAAGAGTVLFFYDEATVQKLQKDYPLYADNFPLWALQASGMLQFSVWSGLRELGVGASLQHYNPVIDPAVRRLFGVPESCRLIAQMPFGGIGAEPEPKEPEDTGARVRVFR